MALSELAIENELISRGWEIIYNVVSGENVLKKGRFSLTLGEPTKRKHRILDRVDEEIDSVHTLIKIADMIDESKLLD